MNIYVEPYVDSIKMPENVKIGLMISEARKKCQSISCPQKYYGFAFGQSPFHVPESITKALGTHADKGHYSDAQGIPPLREAITGFNKRHFNLDVDPSRIFVGPGTKEIIHFIFNIIKGGIIIPSPSWIGYFPLVNLEGKHYHTFHLKSEFDYKIQPDDLDEFIKKLPDKQHVLVLNSPHNPTGLVYNKSELDKISEVCRENNTLILSDEIYALTTYNLENFTTMSLIYPDGAFVTNGLSKDRSAGGYRLGYCVLPEGFSDKLKEDFKKVAATVYTNVSTPTQYAAITAYEPNSEIEEYFNITREIHRMFGQYLSAEFNTVPGIKATQPHGGFYFYVDFNDLAEDLKRFNVKTSNDLMRSLISHPYHIALITGDSVMLEPDDFGARIAFVDYNGKAVYGEYKNNPPKTKNDEEYFIKQNASRMIQGVEALRKYVGEIQG
jgi:aspartate aminotransferase